MSYRSRVYNHRNPQIPRKESDQVFFSKNNASEKINNEAHFFQEPIIGSKQNGRTNNVRGEPVLNTSIKEHGGQAEMPDQSQMPCLNHFNPDGTYDSPRGEQNVHFEVNSSRLSDASLEALKRFRENWRRMGANAPIELNGYASVEGRERNNWILSCNRVQAVVRELIHPSRADDTTPGIPSSFITVFANGETNKFGQDYIPNRTVTLISIVPITRPVPKCGPDVTNWFITTVNAATSDPRVLSIRTALRKANLILAMSGTGLNTNIIAEAAVLAKISAQLSVLGSKAPPLNPTIVSQLAAGTLSAATLAGITANAGAAQLAQIAAATLLIRDAAMEWKALVDHGAPFDFKRNQMNHPRSPNCPGEGCVSLETGVITLCPRSASENCYESDITGNIFYALIGKFIGWSRLTLQLGSQFAELTDPRTTPTHPAVTWDTPDDTFAIDLGYDLRLPLTNADLCTRVGRGRPNLSIKAGCDDCAEVFS